MLPFSRLKHRHRHRARSKRRKTEEAELDKLLHLNPDEEEEREELDCDAIISAARQNPKALDLQYDFPCGGVSSAHLFPLHQAILLRAPVHVIEALCSPVALKGRTGQGETALHFAVSTASVCASSSASKLLLEKYPGAAKQKNILEELPLHTACEHEAPLEVVSLLLDVWPGAAKEKSNADGGTPLHFLCEHETPLEVVPLLLDAWPGAVKEKNYNGDTPLHLACQCYRSFSIVSLLLTAWSGGAKEKNNGRDTPLHLACRHNASFDIVLLLVNEWPEAVMQKNRKGLTPFDLAQQKSNTSENAVTFLSHASVLFDEGVNDSPPNETMNFFVQVMWRKGIRLLLNKYPTLTKTMKLQTYVMADFLSMGGDSFTLITMWEVIRNEQELLAQV